MRWCKKPAPGYRPFNRHAVLFGAVLIAATLGGASAAQAYDANHDHKLKPPSQQQTERALDAGERFQSQMLPAQPADRPVTPVPDSYTAQPEAERVPVEPPQPYDYYRRGWGSRAFWLCYQLDPFDHLSIPHPLPPWRDDRFDRDGHSGRDPFDIWCFPPYGPVTAYPYRGGWRW